MAISARQRSARRLSSSLENREPVSQKRTLSTAIGPELGIATPATPQEGFGMRSILISGTTKSQPVELELFEAAFLAAF